MNNKLRRFSGVMLAALLSLTTPQIATAAVGPEGFSEAEVLKLVVGKTADDVKAALGEPQRVVQGKDGIEHWYYEAIVRIGSSMQRFGATEVVLTSGQVNHLMNHMRMPTAK